MLLYIALKLSLILTCAAMNIHKCTRKHEYCLVGMHFEWLWTGSAKQQLLRKPHPKYCYDFTRLSFMSSSMDSVSLVALVTRLTLYGKV